MRVNLDIDFTKSTLVKLSLQGILNESNLPYKKGDGVYGLLINTPSAAFPIRTQNDFWGSNNIYKYNPLAEIASTGYKKNNQRALQADLKICQDLSYFLTGLSAEVGVTYDNFADYYERQSKDYEYEVNTMVLNSENNQMEKSSSVFGNESNLSFSSWFNNQYISMNIDAKIAYNRVFGKHTLGASFAYRQEEWTGFERNKTKLNQHLITQLAYSFDNKYILDLGVNHSGSGYLAQDDKFRTYYALSGAWVVSNESFYNINAIDFLKLRASYGIVGMDALEYELDKQYWVYGGSYNFGDNASGSSGLKEGPLALLDVEPIKATKFNLGFDATVLENFTIAFDYFNEHHENSLVSGTNLYSGVVGIEVPKVTTGETKNNGFEISLGYHNDLGDLKYYAQINLSQLNTEIVEASEGYKPHDYLYRKGKVDGQLFGLEAIGFFEDDADIQNSPQQKFGNVKPGDIKYKDQNGDDIINQYDEVALGNSTKYPELYYGLKLGVEYKGFGVDLLFDGANNISKMMNMSHIVWPLKNNGNISEWYLKDNTRWTPATKESANLPRLTTVDNPNNFRNNSLWMVDASYFCLRNVNVFYNLPKNWIEPIGLNNCKLYVRANNVLTVDDIDVVRATHFSVSSPDMMSLYFGVKFNF
jgi:TonB-linked SusC/RagA family outer membrane protein